MGLPAYVGNSGRSRRGQRIAVDLVRVLRQEHLRRRVRYPSHRPGPVLKRLKRSSLQGQYSEVHARKRCRGWCPSRLCALSISIHPFQMSSSNENDSSHRSGGASDCEGSAASSHESELPDTRTPSRNEQNRGRVWILRGEITTDLLHNDSASMDCDDDQDSKV